MSLLNQVLQDLDDRAGPAKARPVRLATAPAPDPHADDLDDDDRPVGWRIGIWSLVVAALALALAAWVFYAPWDPAGPATAPALPVPGAGPAVAPSTVSSPGLDSLNVTESVAVPPAAPVAEDASSGPHPGAQIAVPPGASPAQPPMPAPLVAVTEAPAVQASASIPEAVPERPVYLPLRNVVPPPEPVARPAATRSKGVKTATPASLDPLESAHTALAEGELAHAETLLQQRLRSAPADLEARELLVGLMLRGERYDTAMQQLDLGLAQQPGHMKFVLIKARLLAQAGDADGALSLLEAAPDRGAGRIERLQMLGALYQQQGRLEAAAEHYRALLALSPQAGPAWVGLAICLDGLGDGDAAQAYRRALTLGGLPGAAESYARERLGRLERSGG